VSDLDQALGANYVIPPHLIDLLFDGLQPFAPIKLVAFNSAENAFDLGSNYVIGKDSLAHLPVPNCSPPPLIPITREFLKTVVGSQSRFDALKGPCVVHDRN